jgi:hypothetical protein
MIQAKYRHINPNFMPGEKFVAINKAGEMGAAWSYDEGEPRMAVRTSAGADIFRGTNFGANADG